MRQFNIPLLKNEDASVALDGPAIDLSQIFQASIQVVSTTSTTQNVHVQVSNDIPTAGALGPFTPANWSDLTSAVAVTSTTPLLIPKIDLCYQWLRLVTTGASITPGTAVINANMKALGA